MKKSTRRPKAPVPNLEALFYRGNYADVLSATVESQEWAAQAIAPLQALPFVIGALSFAGRILEAEVFYARVAIESPREDQIKARFFLGLAHTRISNYKKAHALFVENLGQRRQPLSLEEKFFVYQGIGFYRFFSGHLRAAEKLAQKALSAAVPCGFLYGKVLAMDLNGHILVQLGEVASGLNLLAQAEKLALASGDGSLRRSLEVSQLVYRSRFGLNLKTAPKEFAEALNSTLPQDTYSKSGLLLELARQWVLRGRLDLALKQLDDASQLIYAHRNRRHEVTLNLRYAYVHFLAGDLARGLNFVRAAERVLDRRVDLTLAVECKGLELKIVSSLGLKEQALVLQKQVTELTKKSGYWIARKTLWRQANLGHEVLQGVRAGEDPLGDLIDELYLTLEQDRGSGANSGANPGAIHGANFGLAEKLLKLGLFGLVNNFNLLGTNWQAIYLNLLPGTLTFFDRGNVHHQIGLTPLVTKILLSLSRKPISKQELLEKVWGFHYDPLRHDSLIYSAMTSLRRLLPESCGWLQTTEDGYGWAVPVVVKDRHAVDHSPAVLLPGPKSTVPSDPWSGAQNLELNYRQQKILDYLSKNEMINVQLCRRLFRTSEITASRDLSHLTQLGIIVRSGRARATSYALQSSGRSRGT